MNNQEIIDRYQALVERQKETIADLQAQLNNTLKSVQTYELEHELRIRMVDDEADRGDFEYEQQKDRRIDAPT